MRKKVSFLLLCLMCALLVTHALAVSGADENEWTITLDFNDGVSRNGAIFVEKSSSVALPTTLERAGYSFAGWTTQDGTSVDTASFQPDGDVTLVAQWEVGKCTVTFLDSDSGEQLDATEREFGATLTELPKPTKEGFTFRYWSLSPNGERENFDNYILNGDTTLYAVWMEAGKQEFEVVFTASQYSDGLPEDKVLYVVKGGSVKKGDAVKDLEREGYKFEGWTTKEPADGTEWTLNDPDEKKPKTQKIPFKPKENTRLYAVWSIQQYMAIFNANYTDSPYKNGVVYSYELLSSDTVAPPEEKPDREGYEFQGWYNKANGGEPVDFDGGIKLSANTGFYAHWKNSGVQTDTFHAEYTEFDPDKKYYGYSGSVQGANCIVKDAGTVGTVLKDDYPTNSALEAGNGYYVSYQYERGDTLRFVVNSSKATTATLRANLAVEVDSLDVASTGDNATVIRVNGKDVDYSLTILRIFQEYEIAQIELQEGENVIEFIVDNDNTVMGGTYRAVGFMTDYIKLTDTDASLTWSPIYDNLEII